MSAAPGARRHLAEVDVLRILTFACVIAVHVIDHTLDPDDRLMWGVLGLTHFTREVFFALTTFVLVYTAKGRPPRPWRATWPRRFLLVGVPYLVWSAVYVAYSWSTSPKGDGWALLLRYLQSLVVGDGGYHLYFLLVTMQVYLLMPLILRFVAATRRHHVLVLAIALVAQLLVLGVWEYVPGVGAALGNTDNATFPSYTFMILAGAIAADHADAFLAWIRERRAAVVALVVGTGALAIVVFLLNAILLHLSDSRSVTALQPVIAIWATGIGIGFLAAGAWWADRRDPASRLSRLVSTASDISFGVFLVHPLVIYVVLRIGGAAIRPGLADPWRQLAVYVVVVAVSIGFAYVARRTPLSLPLTGRPRMRRSPAREPERVAA